MGRPCVVKNFKNHSSDFKEKTHFQNLRPLLPTTGKTSKKFYMGAQPHFFRYTKA